MENTWGRVPGLSNARLGEGVVLAVLNVVYVIGTTVHCTCRVKSIQVQLTFSLLQVLGSQHITEGLTRKKNSTTTRSQRQI